MKKQYLLWVVIILISLFSSTEVVAETPVELSFILPDAVPGIGETTELDLWVLDVENLYAFDLRFDYDPLKIQINNLQGGDFLEPGFVLINTIDQNEAGFAMTQLNPSQPKTGSGVLLKINFTVLDTGACSFKFIRSDLSDDGGRMILHQTTNFDLFFPEESFTATPTVVVPSPFLPTSTPTPVPQILSTNTPTSSNTIITTIPTQKTQTVQNQPTKTPTGLPGVDSGSIADSVPPSGEIEDGEGLAVVVPEKESITSSSAVFLSPTATEIVMVAASSGEGAIPVSGEADQRLLAEEAEKQWEQSTAFQIVWWAAIIFFSGLSLLFIYGIWINDRKKNTKN